MKIGIEKVYESIVEENDTAKKYGSGNLDVYATPAMIANMERAALELAQEHLDFGYTTVGTRVDVKHIKASPLGIRINTVARLIKADGNKLSFEVEAYDTNGMIGSGIHNRYIVNEIEFMTALTENN